ncbi:hypothetical protein I2F27_03375 [Acinetobacter sp. B5B]|uniref:hypothetical protein n=1 Tax=Acinetobacter baretiae TaxID=2605383 RepID=UPI0018C2541E|nr:hypothetical protein [Acinetobacter baretiae]MBF7682371.1 hypothetical protein [Acinetobacter baretiae]MBF7685863.1 hypothetical protein [Acinetobacter baretiae]
MNSKALAMVILVAPFVMFGCAKKADEAKNETASSAVAQATTSADQQAKIDALDKPVLDEKNTDISSASSVTASH